MSVHWGGKGPGHFCRMTTLAAPEKISAPVVSGTAQVGYSLSTTDGLWLGASSFLYQWYTNSVSSYAGATALPGEVSNTLSEQAGIQGDYVFCDVIAVSAAGVQSSPVHSNIVGPVAAAAGGLTAPTLTKTSSAGAAIEWTTQIPSSTYVGYYVLYTSSADGLLNGDGSFTNPTQSISHFITNDDFVNGISHAKLLADGWRDFPGQNYVQAYFYTEGQQQVSPWSNQISDNVTAAVATWDGYIGRARCATDVTLSGTTNNAAALNTNAGTECGVASTVAKPSGGKGRFEIKITGLKNTIGAGVIDGTYQFGATNPAPGSTAAGAPYGSRLLVNAGSTAASISKNNVAPINVTLNSAPAVNDVIAVEFDETANSITYTYHYGDARAADQVFGPYPLTAHVPPAWYAYGSGSKLASGVGDAWLLNTGQTSFVCAQQLAGSGGW